MSELVGCPSCLGDGKETCHNPDHGFIALVSFHDIGRVGCPCCGHDPRHKVRGGGECDFCFGSGKVPEAEARGFCKELDYDYEELQDFMEVKP